MDLPFTPEQFLAVFAQYNLAVWPAQILLVALALIALGLALRPVARSGRIIGLILSFLWIWMGLVYHLRFFAPVNPAAYGFAALFTVQGIAFLVAGAARETLSFRFRANLNGIAGMVLIGYAMLLYPLLGLLLGRVYPGAPTFGLPCPTTIFTIGLLLWTDRKFPRLIVAIPFLWSLVGFSAALTLGMLEDIGLLVASLAGTTLLLRRDRLERRSSAA